MQSHAISIISSTFSFLHRAFTFYLCVLANFDAAAYTFVWRRGSFWGGRRIGWGRKDGDGMKENRVRVLLLRRRLAVLLCTIAAAAGIFYVTLYPASRTAAATTRQLPIYSVERKEKLCSISFDAAWGEGKVRQGRGGK